MERDVSFCPTCGFLAGAVQADAGDPASASAGPIRLTRKETAVFEMIRRGLTNDEIALQMFVTRNTVKFHLKQVYRKLGIRSRRRRTVHVVDGSPATLPDDWPRIVGPGSSTCSA